LAVNFFVVRFLFRHPKLERLAEGRATTLIHQGKPVRSQLSAEVISEAELLAAARRQGFGSLSEIEEAVLEPSGIITFSGKKPEPDDLRHQELLQKFAELSRALAALRSAQPPPTA
jgi:uncharacterized membrane protein YcaP (DUF421 family)